MQFQAFNKILIEDQTITNYVVEQVILGYEFKIRYPFFRGNYLSCIEKLEFKMDGEKLNKEFIFFTLNGKQYLLKELKDQYKEYWYVLEDATITVIKKGGIVRGNHTITVEMRHKLPYRRIREECQILSNVAERTLMAE